MNKEIPNVEGQKLQGTGVSIASLIFLLIVMPLVVTNLVDFAMAFGGGSQKEINWAESNEAPYWESTGSGDGSRHQPGNNDPYTYKSISIGNQNQYIDGDYYEVLPGCENYTTVLPPSPPYECGSDGFEVSLNASYIFENGYIFPLLRVNFVSQNLFLCNSSFFGDSRADFELYFSLQTSPNFTYQGIPYSEIKSIKINTNFEFNNAGRFDNNPGDYCRPSIYLDYEFDYSEIESLRTFTDEFFTQMQSGNEAIIFLNIKIDNLADDNGRPWDSINYASPFDGGYLDYSYINVKTVSYEVDVFNSFLRFGLLVLGVGLFAIAIASTPYWDPVKERLKK